MENQLQQLLEATRQSPVFGDTFVKIPPERWAAGVQQIEDIAPEATAVLTHILAKGMPEQDEAVIQAIVTKEILPKTLAFYPALTAGELTDARSTHLLTLGAIGIGVMYWGDQTMDRGDPHIAQAIPWLGRAGMPPEGGHFNPEARSRLAALRHIEALISELALTEDAPFVLNCFYQQVLHNEARMHRLSQEYLNAGRSPIFIAEHGAELAEISTISAGFPSVSSSLYAIYRQGNRELPPLPEIYGEPRMTEMLQVCNVIVRIWDELGDWLMDSGHDPAKGIFIINPFNEYHQSFVQRFCELALITDPKQTARLQKAFSGFHESAMARREHGAYILESLRQHIRQYMADSTGGKNGKLARRFELYIELCRRVLEIGYVNRIGDIALTS